MNKKRPVNLDLMSLKFPPMAIASILHRISGVLLFFAIPALLYIFDESLSSATGFAAIKMCLSGVFAKILLWLIITGVLYHLIAGTRHIIMDFGWGERLNTARNTSIGVMILTAILSIVMGIWLW